MRPTFFGIPAASSNGGGYALEFDGSPAHVNHGAFWQPSVEYSDFLAEFLIKPTGGGYFCSAGYGGNHCLLVGIDGNSTDGWTLTGNVHNSDTATTTSFTTLEPMRDGVWYYVAVVADGARLTCIYNGVPSSSIAFTTTRKTTDIVESVLYIGGSGHLNYAGRIAGARIFENVVPVAAANFFHTNVYRPPAERFSMASVYDGTPAMVEASFVADYRAGRLDDQSSGLAGLKHNGFLASATPVETEVGAYYNNNNYNYDAATRPEWVRDEFAFPTTAPTGKTPVVGARIYDDFARPDCHRGITATFSLGNTTVGSKAWSGSAYGMMNGLAFAKAQDQEPTFVTDNQVDCTVLMRRTYSVTGFGAGYQLAFRGSTFADCCILDIADTGTSYIISYVGGVYQGTIGGSFNFGTDWLEAKVVLTGDQCAIYKNGALVTTKTLVNNLSGTGAGFCLQRPIYRLSEFAVI